MVAEHQELANPDIVRGWNFNLLCIVGACIGVAALLLTWIHIPETMLGPPPPPQIERRYTPTIVYMIFNYIGSLYLAAAIIFLLGTIAALVSPIGGIQQLVSIIAFAYGIVESGFHRPLDGIDQQQQLGIGMCLGLASCALVLLSLFRRLEKGRLRIVVPGNIGLAERLLTVSLKGGTARNGGIHGTSERES
jgi:hypothetical protein